MEDRFQDRIIAATNRNLQALRQGCWLREDFFYRLCSGVIVVPTLRQRLKEAPRELDHLLDFTITKIIGYPSEAL